MTTQQLCEPPAVSMWGRVQDRVQLAPGIWSVGTASHGGIWVQESLWLSMPEACRETPYSGGGWFEEDGDWAVPFWFFRDEIRDFVADRPPWDGFDFSEMLSHAERKLHDEYHAERWAALREEV